MGSNVGFSTITVPYGSWALQNQTRRHRARTARPNRSKCRIDDVVDTNRCHGGDDFSKNVFACKRVGSNCGAEYVETIAERKSRLNESAQLAASTLE
jgi:hypothetical protein